MRGFPLLCHVLSGTPGSAPGISHFIAKRGGFLMIFCYKFISDCLMLVRMIDRVRRNIFV